MGQLEFTLRLNSPAFVGGAQQEVDRSGIRIPSLRGVLAFWYRSIFAESRESNYGTLYERQGEIFGSTRQGQGLKIRLASAPRFEVGEICFDAQKSPFALYLGYGPIQYSRGKACSHGQKRRDSLKSPPGSEAEFHFVAEGSSSQRRALQRSLLLLHLFGGIGGRSRRGWGSIDVKAAGIPVFKNWNELKADFEAALHQVWADLDFRPSSHSTKPRHSAFYKCTQIRLVGPARSSYEEVLGDFYARFQEVRLYRTPKKVSDIAKQDHSIEIKDAKGAEITEVPKRLMYGLPYQPSSRSGWRISYQGQESADTKQPITRRASPLFLKVLRLSHDRLGDRKYAGVALFLKSEFFGSSGIQIAAKGKHGMLPVPQYDAVDSLVDGWGTEVNLP